MAYWHERGLTLLDEDRAEAVLARANEAFAPLPMPADKTRVRARHFAFLPGYMFAGFTRRDTTPPVTKYAFLREPAQPDRGDDVVAVDWTNAPLYTVNEGAPLRLERDTAADYTRLFFAIVRPPEGHVHLVEGPEDVRFTDPPAGDSPFWDLVRPLRQERATTPYAHVLSGTLLYAKDLFAVRIGLSSAGVPSVFDETHLLGGLPALFPGALR